MPSQAPFVSIIMPNHNGAGVIRSAIESVQAQTFENWELLVIDNNSTDKSPAEVEYYARHDKRIKFLKNTASKGPAPTRNVGITAANGHYIAFLDCDDVWYPTKLQKQVEFMAEHNAALSYTWYDVMAQKGEILGEKTPKAKKITYSQALKNPVMGCLTVMYDAKMLGKQAMPVPSAGQNFAEDAALWLRLMREFDVCAHCLQEKLAAYRLVPNSVSSNKVKAAQFYWRTLRLSEGLSLPVAAFYFVHYAVHGVAKIKWMFKR